MDHEDFSTGPATAQSIEAGLKKLESTGAVLFFVLQLCAHVRSASNPSLLFRLNSLRRCMCACMRVCF